MGPIGCSETSANEYESMLHNIPEDQVSHLHHSKGKGKAVPLQAWTGQEGSRKLRLPDFMTMVQNGGRLSALRTGRFLPPGNTPGTHFC